MPNPAGRPLFSSLVYCDLNHDKVGWSSKWQLECWWCGATPRQRAAAKDR